jgi:RNA polymerase sigma-70 factor, ECF subfamily
MNDNAHFNKIMNLDMNLEQNDLLSREGSQIHQAISDSISGDSEAFTQIYNHYFERIYKFICYRTTHRETSEDLTEEVFIKAYGSMSKLKEAGAFEGWLFQIARNKVIDYYRSKKIQIPIDQLENVLEYENNIIDDINLQMDQKLFLQVLNKLPEEQQTVIKLKFIEDLSSEVIAKMLNKTDGAIRVIQHRAITKLKDLIKEQLK